MGDPLRARPPAQALAWAAAAGGGRVASVRALSGGRALANHLVVVQRPAGDRRALVLRRWARAGWAQTDATYGPEREMRVLAALVGAPVGVPAVVGADPHGERCDVPALLLTRVPGRPPALPMLRTRAALRQLAETAHTIHTLPRLDALAPYQPYVALSDARPPSGSAQPRLWEAAISVLSTGPASGSEVFLHRDFHPGNTLWSRGSLTGLVDWTSASRGSASVDVAHMRWNLAASAGIEAADVFLAAYGDIAGTGHDPWWDIRAVVDLLEHDPGWPLRNGELVALERFLGEAMRRLRA